jgi:hypothetical protein
VGPDKETKRRLLAILANPLLSIWLDLVSRSIPGLQHQLNSQWVSCLVTLLQAAGSHFFCLL